MRFRLLIGLVGVCGVLALASDIMAQPLESTTPPVKREPPPPAIPDRDIRPTPPPVPHAPGFLTPLTRSTKNGRVGVAGWTAPNPPVGARGAADPESSGVFGSGLAAEWGNSIPPREVTPPEAGSRTGSPRANTPAAPGPRAGGGVAGERMDGVGVDGSTGLR